jgi:hypothetical protein
MLFSSSQVSLSNNKNQKQQENKQRNPIITSIKKKKKKNTTPYSQQYLDVKDLKCFHESEMNAIVTNFKPTQCHS